ncbi:MAG: hypothetical protein WB392_06925 [Methanotrichaceae archaeon]
MERNTLIAGLKGKYIDVIYTVPTINRLIESGEPGVSSGILRDEDPDCIMLETSSGIVEYLMKTAIIRIVPKNIPEPDQSLSIQPDTPGPSRDHMPAH